MRAPHPLESFTRRERALIDAVHTPRQMQRWLRDVPYNRERRGPSLRSFRGVLSRGRAHCLEAVFVALTVLHQHGWPTWVLDIESQDGLDHVLFLYERAGRWGTVARSRDEGLHGRPAVFRSVEALVESYMDPYVDATGRVVGYGVADLDQLVRTDWRFGDGDMWAVEKALLRMPHKRIVMPGARYRAVRDRYDELHARWGKPTARTVRRWYGTQVEQWW
jgi:hypothetical protein